MDHDKSDGSRSGSSCSTVNPASGKIAGAARTTEQKEKKDSLRSGRQ